MELISGFHLFNVVNVLSLSHTLEADAGRQNKWFPPSTPGILLYYLFGNTFPADQLFDSFALGSVVGASAGFDFSLVDFFFL